MNERAIAEYLVQARKRDAYRSFGAGAAVIDVVCDPVLGEDVTLVSYVDESLWSDNEFERWLASEAARHRIVVRRPEMPPSFGCWSEFIRYVRLDQLPDLSSRVHSTLEVRPARGHHEREFVRECLSRAIEAGYGERATIGGVSALADELMGEPGVVSHVAIDGAGRLMGQITYRSLDDDETASTHEARTELVDAFSVERPATPVIDRLVSATIGRVAFPVLGTVSATDAERREQIIADLSRDGWVPCTSDWVAER